MVHRMLLIGLAAWLFLTALLFLGGRPAVAQNVYVSAPVVNSNDSFYEWFGIDWGYRSSGRNGNFFFNRGSSRGTAPVFGGFDPASASRMGFAKNGFFFNFTAAQGSNRTVTSSTPSVNLYPGTVGSVRDVQMRPFVTGLIPVVGSSTRSRVVPPTLISPLKERLARLRHEQSQPPQQQAPTIPAKAERNVKPAGTAKANEEIGLSDLVLGASANPPSARTHAPRAAGSESTAERGDISVAEIRSRQKAAEREEAEELNRSIEEAKAAEAVGRFGAARVRYRQAAARATGDQRRALLEKLESIRDR